MALYTLSLAQRYTLLSKCIKSETIGRYVATIADFSKSMRLGNLYRDNDGKIVEGIKCILRE